MKKHSKNDIIMTTGCAINKDMYYMSCSFSDFSIDESYSRLFFYQHKTKDKWFYHDRPEWRVVSTCFQPETNDKPRMVYALSEEGDVEILSRAKTTIDKIKDAGLLPTSMLYGYVNKIKYIDGALYVCGHQCQIYRKTFTNWEHIDHDILQVTPSPTEAENLTIEDKFNLYINHVTSLSDITGSSKDNIYTVGTTGFIAHYNGGMWNKLKQITAADLHAIYIDKNNMSWIVGSRGTILSGNHIIGFRAITRKTLDVDFHAITEFNGSFYIGASDGIYRMTNLNIEKEPITAQHVSSVDSTDGVLWALSAYKLIRFDGSIWEEFKHIDN
ncbi:hypothetical protein [Pseudomonas sp. Z3-8]|uniref:hypothetical protein n=1 Tax=Pseudomonas sp. Z3-8 TaxID=2817412 RepID=UPI003DA853D8